MCKSRDLALVTWVWESRQAEQLNHHSGPDPGLRVGYIYPTYELLELQKGPVLQNQSIRISMTQSNNRISEGNPREDPVVTVWQKPEASN